MWKDELLTCLRLYGATLLVCCIGYPLVVLIFALVAAPEGRQGSLLRNGAGEVIGSSLIVQEFKTEKYFWPRPSACGYKANAASGSNLSPANPKVRERAQEIIARLQAEADQKVPTDLVTASGSGLDPHISLKAARFQAARVAKARGVPVEEINKLINQHTDSPTLAVLGAEPVVNVLQLNIALDRLQSKP